MCYSLIGSVFFLSQWQIKGNSYNQWHIRFNGICYFPFIDDVKQFDEG